MKYIDIWYLVPHALWKESNIHQRKVIDQLIMIAQSIEGSLKGQNEYYT